MSRLRSSRARAAACFFELLHSRVRLFGAVVRGVEVNPGDFCQLRLGVRNFHDVLPRLSLRFGLQRQHQIDDPTQGCVVTLQRLLAQAPEHDLRRRQGDLLAVGVAGHRRAEDRDGIVEEGRHLFGPAARIARLTLLELRFDRRLLVADTVIVRRAIIKATGDDR